MNVQAYILNISGIKTLEELMELEINEYMHTVEGVLYGKLQYFYTAPKWIMNGDIVFFYHAVTAKQSNAKLRRYINKNQNQFENGGEKFLLEYLDYCDDIYRKYGGKIYAVGRVSGNAEYSKTEHEHPHFKSRIFAPISDIVELQYPLSVNLFKDFIPISRHTGITPALANDFMKLKSLILRHNKVDYLENCISQSIPLKETKQGNWIKSANENNRRFLYEAQFRKYYVDYMLTCLSDDNKYLSEISCVKSNKISGRADNCIVFNGKYLFVEIKLNTFVESDIFSQLEEYCNVNSFKQGNRKIVSTDIYQNYVLLIDISRIYLYNTNKKDELIQIAELEKVKCMSDVRKIKHDIEEMLNDI